MSAEVAVVIAGFGQMGHAMQSLLRGRAALQIWEISPEQPELPDGIRRAAPQADFLFICVPTLAHAAVLTPMVHLLRAEAATLSIAKGLDDAGRCAAEILLTALRTRPWGVLGGPMIANELVAGKSGYAELGTLDGTLMGRVRRLFPDRLVLEPNRNPQAVSWCGVLKNVYAPLVGICDGLGWGDNARGHIVMAAMRETQTILVRFAGTGADALGDAGLADFVTTVTSPSSHHYALGRRLALGDIANLECEGVHSLRIMRDQGRLPGSDCPLFALSLHIVQDPHAVPSRLHDWLLG